MSEYSDVKGIEFAGKADALRKSLPQLSPYEIAEALGLDKGGLCSTQAILSSGIIMDAVSGEPNLKAQNQLFRLGITLGMAYGIKFAKGEFGAVAEDDNGAIKRISELLDNDSHL